MAAFGSRILSRMRASPPDSSTLGAPLLAGLAARAQPWFRTSGVANAAERLETDPRLAIALEASLLVSYLLIRTLGLPAPVLVAWAAVASLVAVLAPVSGLVLLAAIAPFNGPEVLREFVVKIPLGAALVASVGARWAMESDVLRQRAVSRSAALLAGLLFAGTAFGVLNATRIFGLDFGTRSGRLWATGIGAALLVGLVSLWVARRGHLRPLAVAAGSAAVAALLSLADFADRTLVRESALRWMFRPDEWPDRLSGVVPGPNAMAALLLVPIALLLAAVLVGQDRRVRIAAALGAAPLVVALVLTYSRSALIALMAVGVLYVLRLNRKLGLALLAAGIVVGAVVVPRYLLARGDAVGDAGPVQATESGVVSRGDASRVQAWEAAVRMWAVSPLVGHGFGSFELLHERYGAAGVDAPHNELLRLFAEEGGIVGGVAIAFAVASFRTLWRGRGWLGTGLLGAVAAFAVMALFNNPISYLQVNVAPFVALGTGLALARAGPSGTHDGPTA
jgi:O-antigen ligase